MRRCASRAAISSRPPTRPKPRAWCARCSCRCRRSARAATAPKASRRYEIKKVAVIGAGLMGAGIAYVQAKAGIETVLIDVIQESAEKGKDYSQQASSTRTSARGKITKEKGDALLALIKPSTDYNDIKGADLVDRSGVRKSRAQGRDHQEGRSVPRRKRRVRLQHLDAADHRPRRSQRAAEELHRHPLLLAGRAHGPRRAHHGQGNDARKPSPRRSTTSSRSRRRRSP